MIRKIKYVLFTVESNQSIPYCFNIESHQQTKAISYCPEDKSTYPLFGSAGTCTALEFDESAPEFRMHLGSDGSGWRAIHAPDGGFRNPPTGESSRDHSGHQN